MPRPKLETRTTEIDIGSVICITVFIVITLFGIQELLEI
jgi:hypothetical protein